MFACPDQHIMELFGTCKPSKHFKLFGIAHGYPGSVANASMALLLVEGCCNENGVFKSAIIEVEAVHQK